MEKAIHHHLSVLIESILEIVSSVWLSSGVKWRSYVKHFGLKTKPCCGCFGSQGPFVSWLLNAAPMKKSDCNVNSFFQAIIPWLAIEHSEVAGSQVANATRQPFIHVTFLREYTDPQMQKVLMDKLNPLRTCMLMSHALSQAQHLGTCELVQLSKSSTYRITNLEASQHFQP